jgi:hypothetical protein
VSSFIAEQTGLWAAWDRDRPLGEYYTDLRPLPTEDVRRLLQWTSENLAEVATILRTRCDGRVLELCYEDLFLGDRNTRWRLVESLWAHLGVSRCESPRLVRLLEYGSFHLRQPGTYERVPNLAEIEATLGSEETGHIGYLAP